MQKLDPPKSTAMIVEIHIRQAAHQQPEYRYWPRLKSQTFNVNTFDYFDEDANAVVTLVDTPGFDDSRDGVTDTDVLRKMAIFLQEEGGRKLNGLIFLHRISDPRLGGQAVMNLKMFRELCGEHAFGNVRLVTTFWGLVNPEVGLARERELAEEIFRPFIDGGAKLLRLDKGVESARLIVSELLHKVPVVMRLQEELAMGMVLGDTSAGSVMLEEMRALQRKHEQEMDELRRELEQAAEVGDEELRAGLAEDARKIEQLMVRIEAKRKALRALRFSPNPNPKRSTASLCLTHTLRWFAGCLLRAIALSFGYIKSLFRRYLN